jgi:signal transduction histidine kinase
MLPDRFDDAEYRDTAARLLPMEVARIVGLADRLRLMAPSQDGKMSAVELSTLLNDLVALHGPAADEQNVKIILDVPDRPCTVLGDRGQLIQLFLNLVRNAVEAMPEGGSVTIRCSEPAETITVELRRGYWVSIIATYQSLSTARNEAARDRLRCRFRDR